MRKINIYAGVAMASAMAVSLTACGGAATQSEGDTETNMAATQDGTTNSASSSSTSTDGENSVTTSNSSSSGNSASSSSSASSTNNGVTTQTSTIAGPPENLSADILVYPGAVISKTVVNQTNDRTSMLLTLKSNDDSDKITSWYRQEIEKNGYKLNEGQLNVHSVFVEGSKASGERTSATIGRGGDNVIIILKYEK